MIQGPYPRIRESLRQRGWVERFLKMQGPGKKSPRKKKKGAEELGSNTDSDDSDDDDADPDVGQYEILLAMCSFVEHLMISICVNFLWRSNYSDIHTPCPNVFRLAGIILEILG